MCCKSVLDFGSRGITEDSTGSGEFRHLVAAAVTAAEKELYGEVIHSPGRAFSARAESATPRCPPLSSPSKETVPADLDRLIHERVRLGIVSALAVNRSLTFNELKAMLKTTDGNLSVHARKLEEADYIVCTKSFDGRLPKTEYRLDRGGAQGLGALPESHGSPDSRNARRLSGKFFCPCHFVVTE